MSKKVLYRVTLYQMWGTEIVLKASSEKEAKDLAWKKFKPKRKYFEMEVEKHPTED